MKFKQLILLLFLFQLTRYISLISVSEYFEFFFFIQYVLLATISNLFFLIIPYFVFNISIKKYSAIISVPLVVSNIFYFIHLFYLKTPISLGAIAVIGETTPQETIEFLSMVGFKIIFSSIILAALPLTVLIPKDKVNEKISFRLKISVYFILPIYLLFNIMINQNFDKKTLNPFYNSFVFNDLIQIRYYYKEQAKLMSQIDLRVNNTFNAKYIGKKKEQNIILIIGESMSKYHLPFYGYSRNTMPKLSRIEDNFFVFNEVISPATQTRESILRMLTMAEEDSENFFYDKASIIKAANESGYETSWISNQMMLGISDTETSVIAKDSKYTKFINSDWHTNSLDENLLPYLRERLNGNESKKMIIIHMLGNHFAYKHRYPANDNYFKELKEGFPNYLNDDQKKDINHYDNSVRYSDQFIYNVINEVQEKNVPSIVIYLSDHGEELYDDENMFVGHGSPELRREAVDIPFFMWYTSHYDISELPANSLNNEYNSGNLFYTLADVLDLSFDEFDETKSIISPKFISRKRRVINANNKLVNYSDIP